MGVVFVGVVVYADGVFLIKLMMLMRLLVLLLMRMLRLVMLATFECVVVHIR